MDTRVVNATDTKGNRVELATIIHDGHEFTALGAILDPERPSLYCGNNGKLTTWEGDVVGSYRVTNTYYNNVGARMDCIEASFNGRTYYVRKSHDWTEYVNLRPHKNQ
jgi:hypothetical protein